MGVYFYADYVFGKLFAAWRPTLSSPFTNVFQSLSRDSVYSNDEFAAQTRSDYVVSIPQSG